MGGDNNGENDEYHDDNDDDGDSGDGAGCYDNDINDDIRYCHVAPNHDSALRLRCRHRQHPRHRCINNSFIIIFVLGAMMMFSAVLQQE